MSLAISLVRDADGLPLHCITQTEDISERKRLEATLRHLADHDPLTDLWNRRRFQAELQYQVEHCQRYGDSAALLLLDLDRFKAINDTYGPAAGDQVLKAVAVELRGRLRNTDLIARLGGDEFAIILSCVSPAQANRVATSLADQVAAKPIKIGDTEITATTSIGIAVIGEHETPADALRHADRFSTRIRPATAGRPLTLSCHGSPERPGLSPSRRSSASPLPRYVRARVPRVFIHSTWSVSAPSSHTGTQRSCRCSHTRGRVPKRWCAARDAPRLGRLTAHQIGREVGTSVRMIEQHHAGAIANWNGERRPAEGRVVNAR